MLTFLGMSFYIFVVFKSQSCIKLEFMVYFPHWAEIIGGVALMEKISKLV